MAAAGVGGQPFPFFVATIAGVLPGLSGVAGVESATLARSYIYRELTALTRARGPQIPA
jgi:hypothetical protein